MMKKSQILAAIALAMALGVVAPVSSANAKVSDLDASQASSVSKSIDETVDALTETAGKIGTSIDENITSAKDGKKVGLRSSEWDLYEAVSALAGAVTERENNQITALMQALSDAKTDSAAAAHKALGKNPTYAAVVAAINGEIATQKAIVNNNNASEDQRQEADGVVKALEDALNKAEGKVVDTINGNSGQDIEDVLDALEVFVNVDAFEAEDDGNYSLATYRSIMAAVNKVPKYNLFSALFAATAKAQEAKSDNGASMTYAQALQAIADLEAAIKAFGVSTPETPELPSKDDATNGAGAPNTGIVGTAEGTATTVSIVAGLATALTALGAGVVAYRSARRK